LTIILADVFGSPNIGVYCSCNEKVAIVPPGLTNRKISQLAETLGVSVCKTTIGGSTLVGALVTGNSNGVLVPHTIRQYELERIEGFTKVAVVESKWTALGNVVLTNDLGAVIHKGAPPEIIAAVNQHLEVSSTLGEIGLLPFVGSLAIATNKGALVSPSARNEEQSMIASALHVTVEQTSTNGGVPFVKSGILANTKGAVVGPLTRGAELMQISRALGV